jgi:hypothetical protein
VPPSFKTLKMASCQAGAAVGWLMSGVPCAVMLKS